MNQFDTKMTALADAIKAKNENAAAKLTIDGMIEGVEGISTGSDIPAGITVTPADVKEGVFYIDGAGAKAEGEMVNRGELSVVLTDKSQSFEAGYYDTITVPAADGGYYFNVYECLEVHPDDGTWLGAEKVWHDDIEYSDDAILIKYAEGSPLLSPHQGIYKPVSYRLTPKDKPRKGFHCYRWDKEATLDWLDSLGNPPRIREFKLPAVRIGHFMSRDTTNEDFFMDYSSDLTHVSNPFCWVPVDITARGFDIKWKIYNKITGVYDPYLTLKYSSDEWRFVLAGHPYYEDGYVSVAYSTGHSAYELWFLNTGIASIFGQGEGGEARAGSDDALVYGEPGIYWVWDESSLSKRPLQENSSYEIIYNGACEYAQMLKDNSNEFTPYIYTGDNYVHTKTSSQQHNQPGTYLATSSAHLLNAYIPLSMQPSVYPDVMCGKINEQINVFDFDITHFPFHPYKRYASETYNYVATAADNSTIEIHGGYLIDADATATLQIEGYMPQVGEVYAADTLIQATTYPDATVGALYRCLSVDAGTGYASFSNISITGVTTFDAMNALYSQTDPTAADFERVWTSVDADVSIAWDADNSAWCIYSNVLTSPQFSRSLFYAKIEGMSAEKGTSSDPFYWDADGVVGNEDRTLTVDYDSSEASYDDYGGGWATWNVYARLKAGTEYTLGIVVPPDNEETGESYYPTFEVHDLNNTRVAYASSRNSTAVTIGGKECTWYCKYTPTTDGFYRLSFYSDWPSVTAPFVCSPAPETTVAPATDIFEQDGNWKIGGGENAGVRVLSAGLSQCVGDYTLILGDGINIGSVWQNADGSAYIYAYQYSGDQYCWYMGETNGTYNYYYRTATWDKNTPTHPSMVAWTDRNSSSYGDLPVVELAPTDEVAGTPILTEIHQAGRDTLGYSVWTGVEMRKEDGVWVESGELRHGLLSNTRVPMPNQIYNADASVWVENLFEGKSRLLCWGGNRGGELGLGDTTHRYIPVSAPTNYPQIATEEANTLAIDEEGHLFGWGYNDQGQLGLGDTSKRLRPEQISEKTWQHVAMGSRHAVGIDTNGFLWTWGSNAYGQLGNGDTTSASVYTPTQVGTKTWRYAYANGFLTALLDTDGYMYVCGRLQSQMGYSSLTDVYELTKNNEKQWKSIQGWYASRTYAIDIDGYLWGTGGNQDGCLGVGDSSTHVEWLQIGTRKWKKVVCGYHHTLAISQDNRLWGCGAGGSPLNGVGGSELVLIPGFDRVRDCAAFWQGFLIVDEYGRAWVIKGDNTSYALCLPFSDTGINTEAPHRILEGYDVQKVFVTSEGEARFAIVTQ